MDVFFTWERDWVNCPGQEKQFDSHPISSEGSKTGRDLQNNGAGAGPEPDIYTGKDRIAEDGTSTCWIWKDFGLKYAGESKEQQAQVVCAGDNLIHLSLLAAEQKKQKSRRSDSREFVRFLL